MWVARLMRGLSLRTIETVATETFAWRATSRRLTGFPPRGLAAGAAGARRGWRRSGNTSATGAELEVPPLSSVGPFMVSVGSGFEGQKQTVCRLVKQFNKSMNDCNAKHTSTQRTLTMGTADDRRFLLTMIIPAL